MPITFTRQGGKKKTPDKALSHTVDSKGNLILH